MLLQLVDYVKKKESIFKQYLDNTITNYNAVKSLGKLRDEYSSFNLTDSVITEANIDDLSGMNTIAHEEDEDSSYDSYDDF